MSMDSTVLWMPDCRGRRGLAAGSHWVFEHGGSHVPGAAQGRATWQQSTRQLGLGTVGRKATFWEEKLFKRLRNIITIGWEWGGGGLQEKSDVLTSEWGIAFRGQRVQGRLLISEPNSSKAALWAHHTLGSGDDWREQAGPPQLLDPSPALRSPARHCQGGLSSLCSPKLSFLYCR